MMEVPATTSSTGNSRAHGARTLLPPRVPRLGVTLVELLIVLAVIGMIVGISVAGLTSYSRQLRLKATTRQAMRLISLARSLAISSHEDHAVIVDVAREEIRAVNAVSGEALEQAVRLPSSVGIELRVGGAPSAEEQFTFRPTGSLTGRTVSLILSDQETQHVITVTASTGAMTLE